jgi:hypothetical protein
MRTQPRHTQLDPSSNLSDQPGCTICKALKSCTRIECFTRIATTETTRNGHPWAPFCWLRVATAGGAPTCIFHMADMSNTKHGTKTCCAAKQFSRCDPFTMNFDASSCVELPSNASQQQDATNVGSVSDANDDILASESKRANGRGRRKITLGQAVMLAMEASMTSGKLATRWVSASIASMTTSRPARASPLPDQHVPHRLPRLKSASQALEGSPLTRGSSRKHSCEDLARLRRLRAIPHCSPYEGCYQSPQLAAFLSVECWGKTLESPNTSSAGTDFLSSG